MKSTTSLKFLVFILLIVFHFNCGAPGSRYTRLAIYGHINNNDVPNKIQEIEVILPAQYGLTGFDAKVGKQELYGHNKQDTIVFPDAQGNFEHQFKPVVFSAVFMIIPPLGFLPKYGPQPFFGIKSDRNSPYIYIIAFHRKQFEYKVFDTRKDTIVDIRDVKNKLNIKGNLEKHQFPVNDKYKMKGWKVNLTINPDSISQ
jgi:hypothetical protein